MKNIKSWNLIDWSSIEQRVFRLQLRIFKAAKNQEFKKMYKLQKLLIDSYSGKFLAVKNVTYHQKGKQMAGVDSFFIETPKQKFDLANKISLNGKSCPIRRAVIVKPNGDQKSLGIPTVEDRVKQMHAYLALCPQWEARFETNCFGFRPGKSFQDAIQAVRFELKTEKWILKVDLSKSFQTGNNQYLVDKCNTFPAMQKQIRAWLEAGILDGKGFDSEAESLHGGIIHPFLINIALHSIKEHCDYYVETVTHKFNIKRPLPFIGYGQIFLLFHPNKQILMHIKKVVQKYIPTIGLKLNTIKIQLVHSQHCSPNVPGISFLGFHGMHKTQENKMTAVQNFLKTSHFVCLIAPPKESIKKHKLQLRNTIRTYSGVSQKKLIQILNPIIKNWVLTNKFQRASKLFQALDMYLSMHLWKWAIKKHPKMPKTKIKEKYWHKIGNTSVFAVKKQTHHKKQIYKKLQYHSKICVIKKQNSPIGQHDIGI